jgi:hypothetical protein
MGVARPSPSDRRTTMKYLCLAYYDEKKFETLSGADLDAIVRDVKPYDEDLRQTGALVAAGSLGPSGASTTIRPRGGKVSVTDGPFAETKEQVGGFFIIEARDLNEAIRVASKHPAAHLNEHLGWGIEVRPIEVFRTDDLECRLKAERAAAR